MSGFTVNGTDLNSLLMQSTNNNSGLSGFVMANGQDLYAKYGKWDNLPRNQPAVTGFRIDGEDINRKFNKIEPTFQATLSGTFTYTGRSIQPNILVSPDDTTDYTITYNGNKTNTASYLAVENDFTLPPGYVWDSGYPQGSFTINAATLTGTATNATLSFNEASQTRTVITGINAPASGYTGSPDATGTNGGTYTTLISGTGNYSGSVSGGNLYIVQAIANPVTSQPTDGTADSGSSVTLSVTGSGLPSGGSISYQWYTSSGSIVSGATNSSYSASTSGDYYCTVTYIFNSVSHSINSNTVTVTINEPINNEIPTIEYAGWADGGQVLIAISYISIEQTYDVFINEGRIGYITVPSGQYPNGICGRSRLSLEFGNNKLSIKIRGKEEIIAFVDFNHNEKESPILSILCEGETIYLSN